MSSEISETHSRILEATVRTLAEQGGKGVRMADIARETGISRQAIYLHFASRAELLIAAIRYTGDTLNVDQKLEPSRQASSGIERLRLYIEFWGNYIPEIYPVAKALMLAQDQDKEAAQAWNDRMLAMRDGCRAAIEALYRDGNLAKCWTRSKATDALWTMLLVPNWESLTNTCGWTTREYIQRMQTQAERTFVVS